MHILPDMYKKYPFSIHIYSALFLHFSLDKIEKI